MSLAASLVAMAADSRWDGAQHRHTEGDFNTKEGGAHKNTFARELSEAMNKMHKDMLSSAQTGNVDVDFLSTMIPHHAGAVEMARLVLIEGKDPLVRRLAEEIIAGQQAEIAAMKGRLAILIEGADPHPDGYPALGSTRGPFQ